MAQVDFDALIRTIEGERVIRLFGEEQRGMRELPYRLGIRLQNMPLLPPAEQDAVLQQALQHVFGAERLAAWEGHEEYGPAHTTLLVAYLLSGFSAQAVEETAQRLIAKNAQRLTETMTPSTSVSTGAHSSPTSGANTRSTCCDPASWSGENSSSCCAGSPEIPGSPPCATHSAGSAKSGC